MKGTVRTTRLFDIALTEEEAQDLSLLGGCLQPDDLEQAVLRSKAGPEQGERIKKTALAFFKAIREIVHEPSSR